MVGKQGSRATAMAAMAFAVGITMTGTVMAAQCGTGLDSSQVTFRDDQADACAGPFSGNPVTLTDFNTSLGGVAGIGGGWDVLERSHPGGTTWTNWNGFRFGFYAEPVIGPSPASGNFLVTVSDLSPGTAPGYPISFDLLIAPESGTQWAGYLFDDETFTLDGTGKGAWRIGFNGGPGGSAADLSRMNFLLRDFIGSDCEVDCSPPGGGPVSINLLNDEGPCEQECGVASLAVPEPATLATVLLGLAGLARFRRRRG